MTYSFNSHSIRACKARLNYRIHPWMVLIAFAIGTVGLALAAFQLVTAQHIGWSVLGLVLVDYIWLIWLHFDLRQLTPTAPDGTTAELDLLLPASLVAKLPWPCSPAQLWEQIETDWHSQFITVRMGLDPEAFRVCLSTEPASDDLWVTALMQTREAELDNLDAGALTVALILTTPELMDELTRQKGKKEDLTKCLAWLGRVIRSTRHDRKFFGGIGRDWASGFTPTLERYGVNFSTSIEEGGYRFETLSENPITDQLINTLANRPGAVVVTGATGVGKTSLMHALAQRLLEAKGAGPLAYRQVISLNSSLILSTSQDSGNIEQLVLTLLGEAIQAGNIILALDDAQLFFGHGTGAVDLSQLLLPILGNRNLELVLTMTPDSWQRLSAANSALAGLITRLNMPEPNEADVMKLLEDACTGLEATRGQIVIYDALRAAFRLSGRYNQDDAYPGRALKLIEAAFGYSDGPRITTNSVERAIEATYGVKAGTASGAETQTLLHLEDRIHERMINQTRAVSVVAGSLRRARAGVASPKRPIGSFLFLGPTGVGKTELAKSLAAVYFGDETSMTRLDMSEYQRPDDVARILADTGTSSQSLLLSVRQRPFSVVLLDEIEKAHPDILNLLLQLLDEGQLTDLAGRAISFRDCIVIATSNAGAEAIRECIQSGKSLEDFEAPFVDDLISGGSFKPELLNRFDEIVLFRPLKPDELASVAELMIADVNRTLEPQNIKVSLTHEAIEYIVQKGNDPRLGARPMRRAIQRLVEDVVAGRVLRGEVRSGDTINLDRADLGG